MLSLIDVDGIFAQVKGKMSMAVQKEMMIHSKTGKVTVTTPFQIVLRDSIGDSDAEIAINQTIECQGDVVKVKADARIEYPAIDDAPVEIKRDWGKLLGKVLAAVAVVVVVAAVAAVATVCTGGATLALVGAAVTKVAVGALIGGAVTALFSVGGQAISDIKNGVERSFQDYIYMGVDQFCTGAILTSSLAWPLKLPAQLLGVGICSFTYQGIDNFLDEQYGGDFYDEDTNMILTVLFDIALAGLGSVITKGLNKYVTKVINLPKSEYKSIAKFLNKFFGTNYPTDQAHIND